jgi:hypothetical protein
MKWQNRGRIFDFFSSPFAERFVSHAQSPQAIVFGDYIRVYFTTRLRDTAKTFVSVPQYVDYPLDFSRVLDYSSGEIISRGKTGCFDEHGIFPFSPFYHNGAVAAYTSGWSRRVSVDVDGGCGYAISNDNGKTFQRLGDGPVLAASLWEPFLVIDPFVRIFNGTYYMFYIYGQRWSDNTPVPERVYKIAYAMSLDGIEWSKANRSIIPDVIDENECQALPTVIEWGGRFHMYFCYRDMTGFRTDSSKSYRLGYAYSDDLENWRRDDEAGGLSQPFTERDNNMMCYPNIFAVDNNLYMLYNGNDFGKYGFELARLIEL